MKLSLFVPAFVLVTACMLTGYGTSQESTPPQAAQAAQQHVDAAAGNAEGRPIAGAAFL